MGRLITGFDWSRTPLGAIDEWPASLKIPVATMLHSRHPMFLFWGPEAIGIYNDAYVPSFGIGKHPAALGQRGRDCWQEIWPIIGPQIDAVMTRAEPSWHEDALVPILRNGRLEQVYWTYGYSPVIDEHGAVQATLVVCTETTARVLQQRRQATLQRLADAMAGTDSVAQIAGGALRVARQAAGDIEQAFICAQGPDGGWQPYLDPNPEPGGFDRVASELDRRHSPAHVEALNARAGAAPATAHDYSKTRFIRRGAPLPGDALVIAMVGRWPTVASKVMAFSVNPALPYDAAYQEFLDQFLNILIAALLRIEATRVREVARNERDNLLLQAPMGTCLLLGPQHRFELANPLYRQIVGGRDLVGKTYSEAFPELRETALPRVLDEAYASGRPYVSDETLLRLDLDGSGRLQDRWFQFNLQPIRDPAGQVYGLMAVAVDMTAQAGARRQAEEALAERKKLVDELRDASQAKDEFLAMLGHELRNPLSPIAAALELMRRRGDTAHAQERAVIQRQLDHMLRLVDDLMDVSRITRGAIELKRERGELAPVLDKAVELSRELFASRAQRLHVDLPRTGLAAWVDSVRLAQVVSNLLVNAARYTPKGGNVWLGARREGDALLIVVRDDGVGIPGELLPRMFDLFVQGGRGFHRAEGGLGLGLALVKRLVELHGGEVRGESVGVGLGSTFTVRLPVDLNASASGPPIAPADPATEPPARSAPQRILLVDDNVDAAESLAAVLRVSGHEVRVAHEPLAAIEAVRSFTPGFAILDIGLPGMDGYELCERLRQAPDMQSCRMLALTGFGQQRDRDRSAAAGFEIHLVKPLDIGQLEALLREG